MTFASDQVDVGDLGVLLAVVPIAATPVTRTEVSQ